MKHPLLITTLLATSLAGLGTSYAQEVQALRALPAVTLPDNGGHFDHMGVDAKNKRLFMSDEDDGTVEIVGLESGKHLNTLKGFKVPHNIMYLPETNQVLVTDGGGYIRFLDGDTFKVQKEIKLQINCDFMVYDPTTKYVYVTNGGHTAKLNYGYLGIINTKTMTHEGDIRLDAAHIEAVAMEQKGSRIFVDFSDRNSVGVADRVQKKVVAEWKIPDAGENIAIALDEDNKRLFVGCREPARMVVFDTDTGKAIASLPITENTDDMSYDAARKRIYISGAGFVSVIQQIDADNYKVIQSAETGKAGYTSTFAPEVSRFYVASRPKEGSAPQLQIFQAE